MIKTSQFMPYVVFVAAAPVEIMRNMHEQARQRYKTTKMKTVSELLYYVESSSVIFNSNCTYTYFHLGQPITIR